MPDSIRWGILGTGNIAKQFARGLPYAKGAQLTAVGSRAQSTADAFGGEFDVPRRHASYEALAADPEVDAIYVSTPHPFHKDNSILCLEAGKAVLCEKPFTINARETEELIACARREKRFLMEAMWTRYIPAIVRVRELVKQGAIGGIRMISADFGFRAGFDPKGRLFDPAMGGGGLLDVGIYPLSFTSMFLGKPDRIETLAELGPSGVDDQSAFLLGYDSGPLAVLYTAVRTNTPQGAVIMGTEGMIKVHAPFWKTMGFTISRPGKDDEVINVPYEGNGYNFEAEEVGRCLAAGQLESAVMPLDESLELMKTMDAIRAKWGLKYPME
jgi:predicted dehydrogenase